MTVFQKTILWIGVLVICGMSVYPPWTYVLDFEELHFEISGPYHWFFKTPPRITFNKFLGPEGHEIPRLFDTSCHINFSVLSIQWLVVALLAAAFIVTSQKPKFE